MEFNLDGFSDLVDLANKSGAALKTAVGIYDSIKKALGGKEPISNEEMERLVLKLMSEVKDAQLANITLKTELLALHEKAARAQNLEEEFARYQLWKTPAGSLVYKLEEASANGEPVHYLCPNCKEAGKKSILQGHETAVRCVPCDHWFMIQSSDLNLTAGGRRSWDGV